MPRRSAALVLLPVSAIPSRIMRRFSASTAAFIVMPGGRSSTRGSTSGTAPRMCSDSMSTVTTSTSPARATVRSISFSSSRTLPAQE